MRNPFRPNLGDDQVGFLANVVNSTIRQLSTLSAFGVSHNKGRDIKEVFGYPTEAERSYQYYWELFKFQDYAARIVGAPPRSCWRDGVVIRPEEDSKEVLLADEMTALKGAGLFLGLERADVLNRVGSFAALFVGVPDGKPPREPIDGSGGGKLEDVYFSPYSEAAVTISDYETDTKSPRYGLPILYTLDPSSSRAGSTTTATDIRQAITVHWSRVVHMSEGALDNGIYGAPALEAVANRLVDLNKTIGGSAESYYRNASQKYTMDIDKEASITAPEIEALDEAAKAWINGWKDFIGMRGAKINNLSVDQIPPKETVMVALQAISGATGIPIRILTGEGAGQLAGNEDKASYNQLISDRQNQICAPWFLGALRPLDTARLITLPETFFLDWPLPEAMDELTKSEVELNEAKTAEATARAIATFGASPGADLVVPIDEFRTDILRLESDNAPGGLSALGDD